MSKKKRQNERDFAPAEMLASSTQPEVTPPATPEISPPEIAPPAQTPEIEPPPDPTPPPAHDPAPRTPGPEISPPTAPPEYTPVHPPGPPPPPDVAPSVPAVEPPRASFRPPPPRARLSRIPPPAEPARASNTPLPDPRPSLPARPPPPRIELEPGTEITGELLRQLREQRGITLKEIEDVTRVRAASLMAVEAERFDELPHVKIYVKGFVQSLARWIGVDPEQAAASYLHRWDRWRERTPAPKRHFIK